MRYKQDYASLMIATVVVGMAVALASTARSDESSAHELDSGARSDHKVHSTAGAAVDGSRRPNILVLLADDLGYGELGSYGQQVIRTPVLDQLAKEGMRFTNFYAGSPVCSPSRAVLMTGISASFNPIRGNEGITDDGSFDRVPLPADAVTLAELLRKSGYQTGFVGKWHLGDPSDVSTWAYNRGFEYAAQEQWGFSTDKKKFPKDREWINGTDEYVDYEFEKWNCKDEFRTNLALKYLDQVNQNKPFFLFMSYRAPHAHEGEIGNRELYADRGWPEIERRHAAKITCLDSQVGALLQKVNELGRLNNTLVVFTSDNGPHAELGHDSEFFASSRELRGFKRDLYEGGIRVPLIAWWPENIAPGVVRDHVAAGQDLMPTLAEVAGVSAPPQANGNSLLPLLRGRNQTDPPYLNWEFHKLEGGGFDLRQSLRMRNLKAVRYSSGRETELYDLTSDPSETINIAEQWPNVVRRANQIFQSNRSDVEEFPYSAPD